MPNFRANLIILLLCQILLFVLDSRYWDLVLKTNHNKLEVGKDERFLYDRAITIHAGEDTHYLALSQDGKCAYTASNFEIHAHVLETCREKDGTWLDTKEIFKCPSFSARSSQEDDSSFENDLYTAISGLSVSSSSNDQTTATTTLVVGCTNHLGKPGVFVLVRNSKSSWGTRDGATQLIPSQTMNYTMPHYFTVTISDDGSTVAIGSPSFRKMVGAVWIFIRESSNDNNKNVKWKQQTRNELVGYDRKGASRFGITMSLSRDGNTLAVGAPGDNDRRGAVFIFHRNKFGIWKQSGPKLVGTDAIPKTELQGKYPALSGDGNVCMFGTSTGQMFAYVRNNLTGVWTQQQPLKLADDENPKAKLSGLVSLSENGDVALVCGSNPIPNTRIVSCDRNSCWIFKRNKLLLDSTTTVEDVKHQWVQHGPAYSGPGNATDAWCKHHYHENAAYLTRDASHFVVNGNIKVEHEEDVLNFLDVYRRNESRTQLDLDDGADLVVD